MPGIGHYSLVLEYEHTDVPPPGYMLSGPDNNAGMYLWSGRGWDSCPGCGRFLNIDGINPDFNLDVEDGELTDYGSGGIEKPASHRDAKRIFDMSFTYDGWHIASTAFRDTVLSRSSTTVNFVALPREPNFFAMMPTEILEVDLERSLYRAEPICEACGIPKGAAGAIWCLRQPSRLDPYGTHRSDIERGDVNRMSPTVFVGPELAHQLRPLKGVVLYKALEW